MKKACRKRKDIKACLAIFFEKNIFRIVRDRFVFLPNPFVSLPMGTKEKNSLSHPSQPSLSSVDLCAIERKIIIFKKTYDEKHAIQICGSLTTYPDFLYITPTVIEIDTLFLHCILFLHDALMNL